jgi:hypothetical protein
MCRLKERNRSEVDLHTADEQFRRLDPLAVWKNETLQKSTCTRLTSSSAVLDPLAVWKNETVQKSTCTRLTNSSAVLDPLAVLSNIA